MLKKFKTKELVFIALIATLLFVINFLAGGALIAITGIPLMNGILTGITFGIFTIILFKAIPKFGTFTLFLLIYAILEIPTSLGGAPGFWPKIPINVISGLVLDIILLAFNYRKIIFYPAIYVLVVVNTLTFVWFLKMFNVPGVEKLIKILWWFIPLYWVLGTIGILIGLYIWNKIKEKNIIKQIQG